MVRISEWQSIVHNANVGRIRKVCTCIRSREVENKIVPQTIINSLMAYYCTYLSLVFAAYLLIWCKTDYIRTIHYRMYQVFPLMGESTLLYKIQCHMRSVCYGSKLCWVLRHKQRLIIFTKPPSENRKKICNVSTKICLKRPKGNNMYHIKLSSLHKAQNACK